MKLKRLACDVMRSMRRECEAMHDAPQVNMYILSGWYVQSPHQICVVSVSSPCELHISTCRRYASTRFRGAQSHSRTNTSVNWHFLATSVIALSRLMSHNHGRKAAKNVEHSDRFNAQPQHKQHAQEPEKLHPMVRMRWNSNP